MNRYAEDIVQGRAAGIIPFLFRVFLYPFSILYSLTVRIRNALYRCSILKTVKLSIPVISVGNLTAGGTGKTPVSLFIAEELLKRGRKPALLARGYGSKNNNLNDELEMAKKKLPGLLVYQGPDRAANGILAIRDKADCIILDDGFQHRKLARDCDIATVDSRSLHTLKLLLPAGPWREPWNSRKRADIIVLTKWNNQDDLPEIGKEVFACSHVPDILMEIDGEKPLSYLNGKDAVLFSGIGDPGYFKETAVSAGIIPKAHMTFPDHYNYTAEDIKAIEALCISENVSYALTTEKDMVKVEKLLKKTKNNIEFLSLSVKIEFLHNLEGFISSVLNRCTPER